MSAVNVDAVPLLQHDALASYGDLQHPRQDEHELDPGGQPVGLGYHTGACRSLSCASSSLTA